MSMLPPLRFAKSGVNGVLVMEALAVAVVSETVVLVIADLEIVVTVVIVEIATSVLGETETELRLLNASLSTLLRALSLWMRTQSLRLHRQVSLSIPVLIPSVVLPLIGPRWIKSLLSA